MAAGSLSRKTYRKSCPIKRKTIHDLEDQENKHP
jgi:hypothetical protein